MITIFLVMCVIFLLGLAITIISGVIACLPVMLVLALFVLMDVLLIKMIFKKK